MPCVERFAKANFLLMFTLYLKMARLRQKLQAKHEKILTRDSARVSYANSREKAEELSLQCYLISGAVRRP